ncbi:hypothetical protein [Sphingomonas sp. Leaf10]|uniref:hypothetical protein n=1 Tax=Sphingomonas sp. Leaf10 TaxID=1735676 RepID=UPI000A7A6ACA|nr:hypothetical protein [Sphingomonas sp. Leaf10]
MLSIRDTAALNSAMADCMPRELQDVLMRRRDQITEDGQYDLSDLAHMIVVEPGDTLTALEAEAGMPLTDDLPFEFIERHPGGWSEAVIILSDDGFGLAFFVPDGDAIDPELRAVFEPRD